MYKETVEYAYDLLEHFYKLNVQIISEIGTENIEVHVPQEIYELLKCENIRTGEIYYPTQFRHIDIVPLTSTSTITFVKKQ